MILDCTLRDGSYVNNFQFSKDETSEISRDLDKAGFQYIEVGHGIGLGVTERGQYVAHVLSCLGDRIVNAASY